MARHIQFSVFFFCRFTFSLVLDLTEGSYSNFLDAHRCSTCVSDEIVDACDIVTGLSSSAGASCRPGSEFKPAI